MICLTFFTPVNCFADYMSDAQSIADSIDLQGNFNQQNVEAIPGYEGTDIDQTKYYSDPASLEDDSVNKLADDEAGQIIQETFANQGDYQFDFKNDPLFASEQEDFDPAVNIDWLTGQYSDCSPESQILQEDITLSNPQTCDQYVILEDNICQIPRVIEVESNYTYSCIKGLAYSTKNCTKTLNVMVEKGAPKTVILTSSYSGRFYFTPTYLLYMEWGSCNYLDLNIGDELHIATAFNGSGYYTAINIVQSCTGGRLGVSIYLNRNMGFGWNPSGTPYEEYFTITKQVSEVSSITSTWEEVCS